MRTLTEEQIAAAEGTVQRARSIADGDLTAAEHTFARRRQAATAKAICRRCPLQDSCLEGALERGEEFGVWGGTDERDRRAMRRLVARTAA
ncbi:WhiB family transcriptional regulator [Streptomyces californicus]